jgi:hypothetical protein
MSPRLSPITSIAGIGTALELPISPLVGEMSGRTEGGAKERDAYDRRFRSLSGD